MLCHHVAPHSGQEVTPLRCPCSCLSNPNARLPWRQWDTISPRGSDGSEMQTRASQGAVLVRRQHSTRYHTCTTAYPTLCCLAVPLGLAAHHPVRCCTRSDFYGLLCVNPPAPSMGCPVQLCRASRALQCQHWGCW